MTDITETAEPLADNTQVTYCAHDSTGKIYLTGQVPQFMLEAQPIPEGGGMVVGTASIATDYVLDGVITPRPANTTDLSGMKLSNVPNPSTVTIGDGVPTTVTDGEVDIEITQPGTYTVLVSSWPMLDATFSVVQS